MKKGKKYLMGTAFLATMALAGTYGTVSAYQGDYSQKGPAYSDQRHEVMERAFESNDYNAWKEQMNERGRVTEVVTEGNFARFAEARQLAREGKLDEADEIRKELGLRTRDGKRGGHGYGKGEGRGQGRGQGEERGQNKGGRFVDANGDGICDNLN